MRPSKTERLASKGWRVAPAEEFLELTPAETLLVELRLKLAEAVRSRHKD